MSKWGVEWARCCNCKHENWWCGFNEKLEKLKKMLFFFFFFVQIKNWTTRDTLNTNYISSSKIKWMFHFKNLSNKKYSPYLLNKILLALHYIDHEIPSCNVGASCMLNIQIEWYNLDKESWGGVTSRKVSSWFRGPRHERHF